MTTITVGSLCSGIGGLELGVERAIGARTTWQSEVDPHAAKVLAARWPGVPNLGDLRTVDWGSTEPIDLLVAGPPCQPVSQAGRRKGSADERWLWPAVLAATATLRPPFVLFENPLGLMTGRDDDEDGGDQDELGVGEPAADPAGGGWFGDILRSLAGMGYMGRWGRLRSCCTAHAPHQRWRVFIAAALADPHGGAAGRDDRAVPGATAAPREPAGGGPAAPDPHGHGLGVLWGDEQRAGQGARRDADRRDDPWGNYGPAVRRWEDVHGPAPAPRDDRGRLNPELPEWMMGFPPGWVTAVDIPRTAQLRVIGNAVQPQVAEMAARMMLGPLMANEAAA